MKQTDIRKTPYRTRLAFIALACSGIFSTGLFSQITYSFTPAGATGSVGPLQSDINTAYASTNLNAQVTVSAGIQSWTVPSTGPYRITGIGAAGGSNTVNALNPGGAGSSMRGDFTLTQGDVIKILVGQKGENRVAGSGGGGTFILRNGTLILAAGGGGGATSDQLGGPSTTLTSGTNDNPGGLTPGGTNGNGGQACNTGVNNAGGGGGYLTNGAMGTGALAGFANGGGGIAFVNGGTGGMDYTVSNETPGGFGGGGGATNNFVGGGGGGGYSGGAGGQQVNNCNTSGISRSGGGGGGSYNTGTNQLNAGGTNAGQGSALIVSLCTITIFASPPTLCSGKSATLTTDAVSNYSWSTGSTASVIVVSPTVTTTYTLSGTSTLSCNSIATIAITVNPTPTISVTSSTSSVCQGQTAVLTASGASTYTWTGGITNGSSFTPAGTNSYTVTGTSAAGCTNTAVQSITVNPLPVLAISGTTVICAGATTTLSVGSAATYSWNTGATTNTVAVSPSVTISYSVTGTTALGCTSTAVQQVLVNSLPTVSVNSGSVCAGQSFTITPSGASTYTIQGGNAIVSPGTSASYTVAGTSTAGCVSAVTATSSVTVYSLPVISANSGSICAGRTFTIVPSGASTYTISGGSFTVSPAATTAYSVTGTSSNGCLSAGAAVATVSFYALPVISAPGGTICNGQTFTVVPGGANTYSLNGGSVFTVSPTGNTTYSVTGTSTAGCQAASPTILTVTVYALPVISVNSGSICTGTSFTIVPSGANTYTVQGGTAVVNPGASTNYTVAGTSTAGCVSAVTATSSVTVYSLPVLSVNSGSICAGQTFTIVPSGASTYTVSGGSFMVSPASTTVYSVTGTSSNGCISPNTAASTVSFYALPVIAAPDGTICNGQTFTVIPTGASTYTLNGGNTFTVSPTANTSYSVTGTSTAGCLSASPAIVTVTVYALPVIAVNSGSVCAGSMFTITPSGAGTYTISGNSFTVNPVLYTTYSVTGTSTNGCASSNTAVANVAPVALPVMNITSMPQATICTGESATLTVSGAPAYVWSNGATTTSISVSPTLSTGYTVTGTAITGCSNTAVIQQVVDPCTGIRTTAGNAAQLLVYPNPNNGEFTIYTGSYTSGTSIEVYSSLGQLIQRSELTDDMAVMSIKEYSNGIYFVRLVQNGLPVKEVKLIKAD